MAQDHAAPRTLVFRVHFSPLNDWTFFLRVYGATYWGRQATFEINVLCWSFAWEWEVDDSAAEN